MIRTRMVVASAAALLVLVACGGGDHNSASSSAAQPADIAAASRTIDINAGTGLKFDPSSVGVKAGETVAFKVVNPDQINHEFEVGDAEFQEHHAEEMKDMGGSGMDMGDGATGFSIKPGETKTIAFTFPTAGTVLYGCHEPGHYPGGMKGEIKVT